MAKHSDGFGDTEALADHRLRGRVAEFSVDACIPWKATSGVIGGKKIKGDGHIRVVWELYSTADRKVIWSKDVRSEFRAIRDADLSGLYRVAIVDNAGSAAASLLADCPARHRN